MDYTFIDNTGGGGAIIVPKYVPAYHDNQETSDKSLNTSDISKRWHIVLIKSKTKDTTSKANNAYINIFLGDFPIILG